MMPFSPKPKQILSERPPALSRMHRIEFGGTIFIPHMSGALYAPGLRTLFVADLHLEQGTSLARRGIHVPPFDTMATLALLREALNETEPQRLVLLGDSFHRADAASHLEPAARAALSGIASKQETIWISGNHDPAPHDMGGTCVDHLILAGIVLRHEPSNRPAMPEMSGHLHPGCTVVQRGVALRGKCFVGDKSRMILPAFGTYTGALDMSAAAFNGLFDMEQARTWLIGRSTIHTYKLKDLV
jgi:uncharacterized protein